MSIAPSMTFFPILIVFFCCFWFFIRTLPNWTDLKSSRSRMIADKKFGNVSNLYMTSEEESPTQVQQRNIREAEMLTSNLGEGYISQQEILSDIGVLKELAILQESMVRWQTTSMAYKKIRRILFIDQMSTLFSFYSVSSKGMVFASHHRVCQRFAQTDHKSCLFADKRRPRLIRHCKRRHNQSADQFGARVWRLGQYVSVGAAFGGARSMLSLFAQQRKECQTQEERKWFAWTGQQSNEIDQGAIGHGRGAERNVASAEDQG